ncbi:hypothetical protein A3K63_03270 [Candidatus Micrarchaeota archaeon RBG_16_49_10]|nr:MAG: hypothetical protein A3K63_03270 [Candidatus Micrarchaeota archaeon RBG_16_49_10]
MAEFVPIVTIMIFLACVMVFAFSFGNTWDMVNSIFVTPERLRNMIVSLCFYPNLIAEKPYILVTHMLVHADWLHILINMALLLSVGIFLEERIGSFNFLLVFLFSGFCSIVFNILLRALISMPNVASIGASGAVFGVIMLGALIMPDKKVPIIVIPILNLLAIFVYFFDFKLEPNLVVAIIFYSIFSVMMVFLGSGTLSEISHLGGMIGGFVYFWFIEKDEDKKEKRINVENADNYGFSLVKEV